MQKKHKKFTDDGWAIWIEGDDTSTIYLNDWINPKGESYIDVAIRIRGVKISKLLNLYVPFVITQEEIEDMYVEKKKDLKDLVTPLEYLFEMLSDDGSEEMKE